MEDLKDPPKAASANPERWVDEHGDILFHYALFRVRKPDVAQDLVQDTLCAAFRAADKFAGRSTERSWLVGILKNKIIDYYRKQGRETSFTDLKFFDDEHGDRFDESDHWRTEIGPIDWEPEAQKSLDRVEFWKTLKECLSKLPPKVADSFMLREIDNMSTEEICKTLQISQSNLWVMLHRARMALRLCLESNWFADPKKTS